MFSSISAKVLHKLRGQRLPIYIVNHEPLVLISFFEDFLSDLPVITKYLSKNKKVLLLFQFGWEVESENRLDFVESGVKSITKEFPKSTIIFLCNTRNEVDLLSQKGFSACFCNQNAFVDPKYYSINKNIEKKYDAVYAARITPFKRHHLAKDIENLYLIGGYKTAEIDYAKKILNTDLKQATWKKHVYSFNMAKHLQKAKVGLCLSAVEGAMYVSIEYLLTGTPIVSTKCIGGRDEFFTPDNSLIVEDDSLSVSEAVNKIVNDPRYDSQLIRSNVIKKMLVHQEAFIKIVEDYIDDHANSIQFRKDFKNILTHKMTLRTTPSLDVSLDRLPLAGKKII